MDTSPSRPALDSRLLSRNGKITCCALIALFASSKLAGIPGQFVNWDDDRFIEQNESIRSVNAQTIKDVFGKPRFEAYHPLHLASYWIDYSLFGLWAPGYKLINWMLYVACLCLIFRLLCRLGLSRLSALLGCLVLAVHPLHVEPVVWATARKETLSLLFMLGALLAHLRACDTLAFRWRATSLLLFGCALLTKTSTIVLPGLIVLIDILHRRVSIRTAFVRVFPMAVFGAIVGAYVVSLWTAESMVRPAPDSLAASSSIVLKAWWHHLSMMMLPVGLSNVYPIDRTGALDYRALLGALSAALLLAAFIRIKSKWCRLAIGWFAVSLIPVINIVPVYFFVQDRYAFVASIGLAFAVAGIAESVRAARVTWRVFAGATCAVAVLMGVLSVAQAGTWRDSESLWKNAARQQPQSYYARLGFGHTLRAQAKHKAALEQYRAAMVLQPSIATARISGCLVAVEYRGKKTRNVELVLQRSWAQPKALVKLSSHWLREGFLECAFVAEWRAFGLLRPKGTDLIAAASRWVMAGASVHALRLLERAGRDGQGAAWHEIKAQALVLAGDAAKARNHMTKSLEIAPRGPEPLERAASALAKAGRHRLAAFYRTFAASRSNTR